MKVANSRQASDKPRKKQRSEPSLELFQREGDSGSHSVRLRLSQLGLDYVARTVPLGDALKNEQLKLAGGKVEIPFLSDPHTGAKIYGATPILQYLEHEYGEPPETPLLRVARVFKDRVQTNADELSWAVKAPIEQLQKIRTDTREAWKLIGRSVKTVRKAFRKSA